MTRIVSWCLRNKPVVFLATLLLIGSGVFATTRLSQELLPDVEFPVITISTPMPGTGPEAVDEQVTQPVESAIAGVESVEGIQANSGQGFSVIIVEFDLDADTEEAEAELRRVLEGVELPTQAGEPEVQRQSSAEFPIMNISLATEDGDLAGLTGYTRDEVVPLLEEVEGIGRVELVGGSEERLEVAIDPAALEANGLPAAAVTGAIASANANTPVGSVQIDGLATPVRVDSKLETAEALERLPISAASAQSAVAGATGGGTPGDVPPDATAGAAAYQYAAAAPVLLGDVAEVRVVSSDLAGISRTNGEPSLGLDITKSPSANTVEVAEGVQEKLDEARAELGEEQVQVVFDSAEDVRESINGLVQEGVIGAGLAVLVIFVFLRSLRATLVTAVSLPTSVLAALLFSWGYDLTLNILTLAGLTIAVGRVVDDAIVVLENSYRYVQQGLDPEEAALRGTTEVASAITSSTLTTTAVFLPLAVVGGIVSRFFVPLSLTVALALLASLVVSVTIIPVLVSVFIKHRAPHGAPAAGPAGRQGDRPEEPATPVSRRVVRTRKRRRSVLRALAILAVILFAAAAAVVITARLGILEDVPGVPESVRDVLASFSDFVAGVDPRSPVVLAVAGVLGALLLVGAAVLIVRAVRRTSGEDGLLVRAYTPMLSWSVRHRPVVLALAFVVFAGGMATAFFLPVNFFPAGEERIAQASIDLPAGTGLEETGEEIRPFEEFLLDDPGVRSYQISAGGEDNFDPNAPIRSSNQAQAFINIEESANPKRTIERVGEKGRELFGEEGFQAEIIQNGPPQGELRAIITGGTEEERKGAANIVSSELARIDSVVNVREDVSGGTPEVSVEVDADRAAAADISQGTISGSLATLVGGGGGPQGEILVGETPVSVRLPEEAVDSVEEVGALPLGPGLTVGDVAQVRRVEAPSARSRVDGEPAVTVSARIVAQDTQAVSVEAQAALAALDLPEDIAVSVGGENEDIEESFRNLFYSIIIALVLVYLILVIFFGSLAAPLVILLAVPLTPAGAFGALLVTDTALSLPSLLGILLLIGIVVSNAILFVDFATKARDRHDVAEDAILEAGRARLRPILMTALATIFALLPLALGLAGGGNGLISASLAITVIGGLATSTFLTLLVVPVGYSLLESARDRLKKKDHAG